MKELYFVCIVAYVAALTTVTNAGCTRATCPFLQGPPANATFFPHDTDCGRYCMCDWFGSVHDMPCPAGLHWNSVLDTCDWPWNAGELSTDYPDKNSPSVWLVRLFAGH
ncbi:hypothetical protein Trydic_g4547 [Trypoxylus dichotomus]